MNGIEAVARILKLEGVEWVSCFPSNNLIEAIAQEGIRLTMFRQERGAIMAADGYSRSSHRKKFGVNVTQGGPGAENGMGGIAQAYADNIPILLIPGGPPLASWSVKPNFSPSRVYAPISKQTEAIFSSGQVGNVMRRAFHALRNGTGGPVTVETPADIAAAEVPSEVLENYNPPKRSITSPSRSDVKEAVKLLVNAKRPVIWAGGGVLFGDATAELKQFAELADVPVFTTMQGKSAFPEDHPLSLGAGSGATTLPAYKWLQESDVLFGLGTSLSHTGYGQPIPPGKVIIHNSDNITDINKDEAADVALYGDVKATLEIAIDELKAAIGEEGRKTGVASEIAEVRKQWMAEWHSMLDSDDVPINTYRVVGEIDRCLDKNEQHRDSRRRRASRLDHTLLPCHDPRRLYRLGQDDSSGIRHTPDDRREIGKSRQVLPQPDGRRSLRYVCDGPRNFGEGRSAHHDRGLEQRRHGDLPWRLPHSPRTLRRHGDDRKLREPGPEHGRCRHHCGRSC